MAIQTVLQCVCEPTEWFLFFIKLYTTWEQQAIGVGNHIEVAIKSPYNYEYFQWLAVDSAVVL